MSNCIRTSGLCGFYSLPGALPCCAAALPLHGAKGPGWAERTRRPKEAVGRWWGGGEHAGGGAGVGIGRKARLIARQATRTIEEHASKETRDSTASTRLSSYELSYSKGGSCFVPHARWASNTDDVVDMPREEHMHHQTPFDLKDGSRRKKSGIGAYIAKGARLCWPGESNTQEVSTEARKKHLLAKMFSCTRSTKPLTCAARSARRA